MLRPTIEGRNAASFKSAAVLAPPYAFASAAANNNDFVLSRLPAAVWAEMSDAVEAPSGTGTTAASRWYVDGQMPTAEEAATSEQRAYVRRGE